MKPDAQPRRSPTKIIGLAEGRTTLHMIWRRVPRNDLPISIRDAGVFRMAPSALITITGIAMMQTVSTLAVKPMP